MNLLKAGKLRCGITTLNTRLTHGTETENKGGKLGVDYQKKKKNKKKKKKKKKERKEKKGKEVNGNILFFG